MTKNQLPNSHQIFCRTNQGMGGGMNQGMGGGMMNNNMGMNQGMMNQGMGMGGGMNQMGGGMNLRWQLYEKKFRTAGQNSIKF